MPSFKHARSSAIQDNTLTVLRRENYFTSSSLFLQLLCCYLFLFRRAAGSLTSHWVGAPRDQSSTAPPAASYWAQDRASIIKHPGTMEGCAAAGGCINSADFSCVLSVQFRSNRERLGAISKPVKCDAQLQPLQYCFSPSRVNMTFTMTVLCLATAMWAV